MSLELTFHTSSPLCLLNQYHAKEHAFEAVYVLCAYVSMAFLQDKALVIAAVFVSVPPRRLANRTPEKSVNAILMWMSVKLLMRL